MNCEKIREIILTDYVDGRLTDDLKSSLEAHLDHCAECREFTKITHQTLLKPFANLPREKMPESVIRSVMQRVREKETQPAGFKWLSLIKEIRESYSFSLPRLSGAIVLVVCLILSGIGINNTRLALILEQNDFVDDITGVSLVKSKLEKDYGTSLEMYFLNDKEES